MSKVKQKTDKVLSGSSFQGELVASEETLMSGELQLGKDGGPVTIVVRDEEGSELEFSNVSQAWLMIEEKRKSSTGWISLVVGDVEKVIEVIKTVCKAGIEELKAMMV